MKVAAIGIALALCLTGIEFAAPDARGGDPLPKIVATLPAGSGPYLSHYAALTGDTWVGNVNGNNVTVYNDTSLTSIASVYAANPSGIDIDDAAAEVFIPDRANPGHVEIVNETTRVIVKNVSVGADPERAETDAPHDLEYVANYGSGNVSVINTSSLTVTHTIALGGGSDPYDVTYDAVHDEIWVSEYGTGRVVEIGKNLSVGINVTAGGTGPAGLCYDPGDDGVWVGDVGSGVAAEINASTGALRSTLVVGAGPYAVSCDTNAGFVVVGNSGGASVTVIDSAAHVVVDTLAVGSQPYGDRAFDPVRDYVFIANYGSDNVSVLYDGAPAPPGGGGGPIVASSSSLAGILILGVIVALAFPLVLAWRPKKKDPWAGGLAGLPGRYR